jgi:hypothetical protein
MIEHASFKQDMKYVLRDWIEREMDELESYDLFEGCRINTRRLGRLEIEIEATPANGNPPRYFHLKISERKRYDK